LSSARALEISEKQATEIEHADIDFKSANAIRKQNFNRRRNKPRYLETHTESKPGKSTTCRNCGGDFPHANKCPALGKTSNFCRKPNHFAKVCRSKNKDQRPRFKRTVNKVDNDNTKVCAKNDDSSSDDDYVFGLTEAKVNNVKKGQSKMCVQLNDSEVDMLIDTGSSINVIDEKTFKNLKCDAKRSKANTKVYTYGSDNTLQLMGKFYATFESSDKIVTAPVFVVKGKYGNFLSYDTSVDLNIVPTIGTVSSKVTKLCNEYSEI
jgi:hypothetical protein